MVGVSVNAGRASPKSQILSLQSLFARMFLGFKSRWKTFAAARVWRVSSGLLLRNRVKPRTAVYVFQATQELVEEELMVLCRQVVVRLDNLVQVRLHELKDDVDVLEPLLLADDCAQLELVAAAFHLSFY